MNVGDTAVVPVSHKLCDLVQMMGDLASPFAVLAKVKFWGDKHKRHCPVFSLVRVVIIRRVRKYIQISACIGFFSHLKPTDHRPLLFLLS